MTPMTVGDLKAALAEYRDDMLVGWYDADGAFRTIDDDYLGDEDDEAVMVLRPTRDTASSGEHEPEPEFGSPFAYGANRHGD